jgi:formate-dependent nitrite reductase cytochrome c552 subunit
MKISEIIPLTIKYSAMRSNFSVLFTLFAAMMLGLMSCEGDQGPLGPVGPQGPIGPMGENGAQNCINCHGNSQRITAKLYQWENSVHATGGHSSRNQTSCAICHTSQGFVERVTNGTTETMADIEDPLPINCYTCHKIHTTYTEADWAFTQDKPVTLWVGGQTLDLGKGNLCISCHQSRVFTPVLTNPVSGQAEMVNITTTRYGPHHGPQGVMLPGLNGYEVPGPMPYENSAHTLVLANPTANACIVCHMGTAQGEESGGHTFRVISEGGDINTDACVACHSDANVLEDLVADRQAQIEERLLELELILEARGVYNTSNGQNNKGTFTGLEAGALFNLKFVEEDKSRGVHNFKYANALLVNSIAALQ